MTRGGDGQGKEYGPVNRRDRRDADARRETRSPSILVMAGLFQVSRRPSSDAGVISTCHGEFDPGSGRTLAACLTHASRTRKPFGVSTVANG